MSFINAEGLGIIFVKSSGGGGGLWRSDTVGRFVTVRVWAD